MTLFAAIMALVFGHHDSVFGRHDSDFGSHNSRHLGVNKVFEVKKIFLGTKFLAVDKSSADFVIAWWLPCKE